MTEKKKKLVKIYESKEGILIPTQKKITVLLADDHPSMRAGIKELLHQADDIEVVGEASNGQEVFELVEKLKPNILLLDLMMPETRPAEIEKWVRQNYPETVTLVLTSHDRDHYLAQMMDAGAVGYLDKKIESNQLIDAIRRAVHGEILFDNEQYLRAKNWKEGVGNKINQLTIKEIEVLRLLAEGTSNEEISAKLGISVKTVSFHLTNIFSKLDVKSRQEATIWAVRNLSDNLE
ncbi:MAG: response regulator transcription factor [Anaerolineales bacterium]|nr:response regulator transcription factor [Anaerolineales bacterium]